MTRKIFRSILLAAAVALLASLATVMGILYPYFSGLQEGELGEELKLTASAVEQGGPGLSGDPGPRHRPRHLGGRGRHRPL